jgi:hypothetical protein
LDRSAWHELKLTVDGADLQVALDGTLAIEYKLSGEPVAGKVGLWSKTDSSSYFKDYVVHSR